MDQSIEKVQLEETRLEEELENTTYSKRAIENLTEIYQEHFLLSNRLFESLKGNYSGNDFYSEIEELHHFIKQDQSFIHEELEEQRSELSKKEGSIEDKLEQKFLQKKQLLNNSEESENEY